MRVYLQTNAENLTVLSRQELIEILETDFVFEDFTKFIKDEFAYDELLEALRNGTTYKDLLNQYIDLRLEYIDENLDSDFELAEIDEKTIYVLYDKLQKGE